MARIETDPNYTSPTFSRATAATDPFKKEDVQLVAAALSTHDHSTGKGLPLTATSIPNGTITSAMIADGTIDTADLKDGSVTSAKILDGTIQSTDIAAAGIANDRLGPDVARDNLLTNGGFEIWQRGNGPFTAGAAYTADRWQTYIPAGTTISVNRETGAPDAGSGSAAAVTVGGSVSAGNGVLLSQQPFPQADGGLQVRGRTFTWSARVASGTAGGCRLWVQLTGGGADVRSVNYSGGGAYQTLSVTFTVPAAATNQMAILNLECIAAGTYYIDNACLVVGSQPANYVPLHPAEDLARCLRYYEVWGSPAGSDYAFGTGNVLSTTTAHVAMRWRAQKSVTPTVTITGLSFFSLAQAAGGLTGGCTSLTFDNVSAVSGRAIPVVSGGLVAGNATELSANSAPLSIVIEANP